MKDLGADGSETGKYLLFVVAHGPLTQRDGASNGRLYFTRAYANNALDNEFLSPSDLNWFANAGLLVTHFPTLVDTLLGNNGTSLLPGEATILLTDADCGGTEQPEDDADNEPPYQAEDAL